MYKRKGKDRLEMMRGKGKGIQNGKGCSRKGKDKLEIVQKEMKRKMHKKWVREKEDTT